MGASYLILLQTSYKDEKTYNLVCTSWYELPGGGIRSYNNVDSLLNGYSEETLGDSYPIFDEMIDYYIDNSKCELIKMVFSEEGYYKSNRFYVPNNIILAALLKKGLIMSVSDYDGELTINMKSTGCLE